MPNRNVVARVRETRAVEMMTAGATYQQAADELGYRSRAGAWHAVQRALDRRRVEAVDLYRLVELETLDRLQSKAWRRANAGDLDAVGKVVSIINARCRLMGLYDATDRTSAVEPTAASRLSPEECSQAEAGDDELSSMSEALLRLYGTAS